MLLLLALKKVGGELLFRSVFFFIYSKRMEASNDTRITCESKKDNVENCQCWIISLQGTGFLSVLGCVISVLSGLREKTSLFYNTTIK